MYYFRIVHSGYMITNAQGRLMCVIRDGAFAEKVIEALNFEAEHCDDKSPEEYEAEADAVRESFESYKEAIEGDDEAKKVATFNALATAVEGL